MMKKILKLYIILKKKQNKNCKKNKSIKGTDI